MKKLLLLLLILGIAAGTAFAWDVETFLFSYPSPIEKGSILISPAFSIGSYYGWATAIAVTGAFDYALPIAVPIMVGAEAGIATVVGTYADDILTLPIFLKGSWHPNFQVPNLDLYVTLKLGYNINLKSDSYKDNSYEYNYGGGFSYGGNIGARYFFTPSIGVFGELGYDQYAVSYEYKHKYFSYSTSGSYKYYMYTWFHTGITFKI